MISAREIMSEQVVTIHEDLQVSQVAHLMLRDRVSAFPVVRADNELIGIITMTDLFRIIDLSVQQHGRDFIAHLASLKDLRAAEIMSQETVTITPDTRLSQIIRLLIDKNMHTFPVVDQGKIVGIVSRHDILNAVFSYL